MVVTPAAVVVVTVADGPRDKPPVAKASATIANAANILLPPLFEPAGTSVIIISSLFKRV